MSCFVLYLKPQDSTIRSLFCTFLLQGSFISNEILVLLNSFKTSIIVFQNLVVFRLSKISIMERRPFIYRVILVYWTILSLWSYRLSSYNKKVWRNSFVKIKIRRTMFSNIFFSNLFSHFRYELICCFWFILFHLILFLIHLILFSQTNLLDNIWWQHLFMFICLCKYFGTP